MNYLICANPRCGSTLLARTLSDTGIAGHPDEWFLISKDEHQMKRLGSTPNGVFGIKIMWHYFASVRERFQEMELPSLHVVYLIRRDRLRQAISWLRAAQDDVWLVSEHESAHPLAKPCFDYDALAGMVDLIVEGEKGWLDLCERLNIEPLVVAYEDLITVKGYERTVRRVLAHLDLDDTIEVPSPRAYRQADSINDEWAQRFHARSGR